MRGNHKQGKAMTYRIFEIIDQRGRIPEDLKIPALAAGMTIRDKEPGVLIVETSNARCLKEICNILFAANIQSPICIVAIGENGQAFDCVSDLRTLCEVEPTMCPQ